MTFKLKLNAPFQSNGAVNEFDVRQMKRALNHLGYYRPDEKLGATPIPERGIFEALRQFQRDQNLSPTATAKPDDQTHKALNAALANMDPKGKYIWRTVGDSRVRSSHADLEGEQRTWAQSPDPGEEHNCRCWAVSINQPGGKKDCKPEEDTYKQALQKFQELDKNREDIEGELEALFAEREKIIQDVANIFGITGLAGMIPGRKLPEALTAEAIENIVQDQSRKNLEDRNQRKKAIEARIEYLKGQLALLIPQLNQAANEVWQKLKELEECRKNINQ